MHKNNYKEYQSKIKEVVEASQKDMSDDEEEDDDMEGEEEEVKESEKNDS